MSWEYYLYTGPLCNPVYRPKRSSVLKRKLVRRRNERTRKGLVK